ncbi:MAG: type II toxin-antitoxin system PemK/MazF family toxin [Candidatus Gracilibacteria bacterium]|nr:type II toxin-antitoxin system PemK/MazF family toxin [Candidatus Gracilibacteria bacterium]
MDKDFDKWNELKKSLEINNKQFLFKEGEIRRCSLGLNIRQESCGKGDGFRRPILILKKLSTTTFIGIPLSSKIKTGTWFANYKHSGESLTALLYQIRMFDISRFQRRVGEIDETDFGEIKKRLKLLLNL